MDCPNCPISTDCTTGTYSGSCPVQSSVVFACGAWWANHGEDGPFATAAAARRFQETH